MIRVKPIWVSVVAGLFGLSATTSALGGGSDSYYVDARVVDVDPIYEQRRVNNPREVCEQVPRYRSSHHRHHYDDYRGHRNQPLTSLVGGLIGGLVGNQFGGGNGKRALTVTGAIAGAAIANDIARQNRYERRVRERCYVVDDYSTVEHLQGYHVTYVYQGREFSRRMEEHPGDYLRVRVRVSPESA